MKTIGGKSYYISFTDDHSRHTRIYLLAHKGDAFQAYLLYEAWLETQYNAKIKILRSDRGGEYLSGVFNKHLDSKGIRRHLTVHDTPEQNGVAERVNRTLLERTRAMLHAAHLPNMLWGEALMHAVWLKNRTSTKALNGKTPYEILTGNKPNLADLHEWGSKIWIHLPECSKLDGRAKEGRWLGFDTESKGSRVYSLETRRVSIERNIKFEDGYVLVPGSVPLQKEKTADLPPANLPPREPTPIPVRQPNPLEGLEDVPVAEGRGHRVKRPSTYVQRIEAGEGTVTGRHGEGLPRGVPTSKVSERAAIASNDQDENINDSSDEEYAMATATLGPGSEPRNEAEARASPEWPMWREAMLEQLQRLAVNGTWRLVPHPSGKNIVGCRWVFRIKRDAQGKILKYKAHLVAQGYTQAPSIDYHDTYAPVAKLTSNCIILALAARNDWEIQQMDVKDAYLNAPLDEEIYMQQPDGFSEEGKESYVCLLQKSLYGLKQAGRLWYERLWKALIKFGFVRCQVEHCVFYKHKDGEFVIIVVAVDDLTLAASTVTLMQATKNQLKSEFEMTDDGDIHWLLGINIKRDRKARTISLSQKFYIDSMLSRYRLERAKSVSMPMEPGLKLSVKQCPSTPEEIESMKAVPYKEGIGSLLYAALATCMGAGIPVV